MSTYSEGDLLALRDRHEGWLMAQPGVIGTGIGLGLHGQVCLRIFTHQIAPETRQSILAKFPDVPIDWEEGEIISYQG